MKITNQQVQDTVRAIQSIGPLSGAAKAVFALAKNLNRLKKSKADIDDSYQTIFKQHFGDTTEVKAGDPRAAAFNAEIKTVMETEIEFEAHQFTSENLNLDKNVVAPADLACIGWLISDF